MKQVADYYVLTTLSGKHYEGIDGRATTSIEKAMRFNTSDKALQHARDTLTEMKYPHWVRIFID